MLSNNFINTSLESAFKSSIDGISNCELQITKTSLDQLIGQKNAYTCQHGPLNQPWNMITYKNGCKSSL